MEVLQAYNDTKIYYGIRIDGLIVGYIMPLWSTPIPYVVIHYDCQAVIAQAKNKIYNYKIHYTHLRHKIIRQLVENGAVFMNL